MCEQKKVKQAKNLSGGQRIHDVGMLEENMARCGVDAAPLQACC